MGEMARRGKSPSRRAPLEALAVAALLAASPTARAGVDPRVICQPCVNPDECGDHTDLCLNYEGIGGAGAYCGMHCLTDTDCFGLRCLETTAGLNQCADVTGLCRGGPMFDCAVDEHCPPSEDCVEGHCVPGGDPGLGEPCGDGGVCAAGLECALTLAGQICTQPCDWLVPTSCPAGFFCTERDRCGDGICAPGAAGVGEIGAACTMDTDCQGLFCTTPPGSSSPLCGAPCDPATPTCAAGTHCEDRGVGCGSCVADCTPGSCAGGLECRDGRCVGLSADGTPCSSPDECQSGVCQNGLCGFTPEGDGGPPDDGPGGGTEVYQGGCACRAGGGARGSEGLLALLGALLALARRARRSRGRDAG